MRGFDEYVNMVLDDVTEIEITPSGRKEVSVTAYDNLLFCLYNVLSFHSIIHSFISKIVLYLLQTQLDQILLNGANICLLVPGGDPSATSS